MYEQLRDFHSCKGSDRTVRDCSVIWEGFLELPDLIILLPRLKIHTLRGIQ